MSKQKTIKEAFTLAGKGLHSGLEIVLTFNPAPENHGIKIKRVDLPEQPEMDAVAEYVTETTRGTVLKKGEIQFLLLIIWSPRYFSFYAWRCVGFSGNILQLYQLYFSS